MSKPVLLSLGAGKVQELAGTTNDDVLTWDSTLDGGSWKSAAAPGPSGNAGGDLSGTYPDPTVAKIQGFAISTTDPTVGKILQYTGTEWAPADAPQGGSGGGGVMYYFNKGTSVSGGGLPANTYQLGRSAEAGQTNVALTNLAVGSWTRVGGFVTDAGDPEVTTVPAGLWDFNFWADTTAASNNQAYVRFTLYAYNGSTNPEAGTALAQTDNIFLYDANVIAQYIAAMLVPGGTTLPSTSTRLYLLIEAQASTTNRDLTVYFGNSTPTHTHSTVPSVGGTGLVHVIDGVFQSPASLLVNADVAASGTANIARNKLATGTAHAIGVNDGSGYLTGAAALTNGQILIGSTSAAPVAATIAQGTGVTVSNNAGSIQIGIGQSVATAALPSFAGMTLSGMTTAGFVKNSASGVLSGGNSISTSDVSGLSAYALLNSPTFTGTPSLPTGTTGITQTAGNNSTALATTAFTTTAVANAVGSPYDLSGDAYGALASGQTIFRFIAPRNLTLTALASAGGAAVRVLVAGSPVTLPGTISVTSGQLISVETTASGTDAYFTITGKVA